MGVLPSDLDPTHVLADTFPLPRTTTLWCGIDQRDLNTGPPFVGTNKEIALYHVYPNFGIFHSYYREQEWAQGGVNGVWAAVGATETAAAPLGSSPAAPTSRGMQWEQWAMRQFSNVTYDGSTSRNDANPRSSTQTGGAGRIVGNPSRGIITVTAPRNRPLPVHISYTGLWNVGMLWWNAGGADPTGHSQAFIDIQAYLYRSYVDRDIPGAEFSHQNTIGISDFRRQLQIPLYGTQPVYRTTDAFHLETIAFSTWDVVEPGDTVNYWMMAHAASAGWTFLGGTSAGLTPPLAAFNISATAGAANWYLIFHPWQQGQWDPGNVPSAFGFQYSFKDRTHPFQVTTF